MAHPSVHHHIKEILGVIFAAEYRRLGKWIDRIVQKNRDAYDDQSLQGFVFNGKVYKEVNQTLPDSLLKRRGLHERASPDMDAYMVDRTILERDKGFISQALFVLLDPCQDVQEIRDALPECLVDTLQAVRGLPRGPNPVAFTLSNNPRAERQFQRILPRIEMYATTRLIY